MNNNLIEYAIQNGVALITLNRVEKRNALNAALVSELKQAYTQAIETEQVRVIVLNANGKAFCSGADLESIQAMQNYTYAENLEDSEHLKSLFELIYYSPKLTISAVQGPALAGGMGLALLSDLTFATHTAKFGYTEARIGFVPALVSVFMLRSVGEKLAKRLLLCAEIFDGVKAKEYGLVNEIFEEEALLSQTIAFAETMAKQNSTQSVAITKTLMNKVLGDDSLSTQLKLAAKTNAEARASNDCKKGIHSFLSKEPIQW